MKGRESKEELVNEMVEYKVEKNERFEQIAGKN